MNFKILFLLLIVSACGVKGNPTPPKGATTPSVLDNYPDIQVDTSLKETKKK